MANPAYIIDNVDQMLASQYNNALDFSRRNMPDYKFAITVATNDITIALQHADGTDPSVGDPLIFRIDNSYRTINAALSITIVDGTNWFNSGSPELGGNLVGYFPYLVWDSNSSVVALTISRIPWAELVSDFSATTTNGSHAYNYANFTSTDNCVNIGYFEATLSLVATSYLWTVPTFTGINLRNKPTFETVFLNWTPIHSRTGGAYTNVPNVTARKYKIKMHEIIWETVYQQNATPGSSGNQTYTLPFTVANLSLAFGYNANTNVLNQPIVATNTALATLANYAGAAECTASNFYVSGGLGRI